MIEFRDVSVTYPGGVSALKNINLKITPGEFVIIVGLSGAGKSTLLRCINNLVLPTKGEVFINGASVTQAKGKELKDLRRKIGMVFQDFNLVKRSTVLRNVLHGRLGYLPTWRTFFGLFPKEDRTRGLACSERLEILDKANVRVDRISGGQQQKVGLARALMQDPSIILADEPVASLDPPASHLVMRDLLTINREDQITTLINLHFIDLAQEYGQRVLGLREGKLVFDGLAAEMTDQTFEEIYGRPIRATDLREIGYV